MREQPGAKILISGGGRCNFTNLEGRPARALSLGESALLQIGAEPLYAARLHRDGRAPSHRVSREDARSVVLRRLRARDPRDAARANAAPRGSRCACGHRIRVIARTDRFRIETNRGVFEARALVIATGGLSIPKIGATGFAYETARRFGLAIIEPRPGLVGLRVEGETSGCATRLKVFQLRRSCRADR